MSEFNFLLAAPTLKVADKESYKWALDQWKSTIQWAADNFPGMVSSLKAAPPVPSASPVFLDKGPYELEYLRQNPHKRSVRFTTRFREMIRRDEGGEIERDEAGDPIPLYPDKESFCKALLEGKAIGDESDIERPFVSPIDPTGLH